MRKLLLAAMCVTLVSFGGTLFAQETSSDDTFEIYKVMPWALGGSFEFAKNTREDFAPGFGVSLDRYLFTPLLALGLRGNLHNDGVSITATEVLLNFRVYTPAVADNTFVTALFFTQWGFGVSLFSEEGRGNNTYTMDFLAGCRIYINRTIMRGFYVEPFVRTGFPFLFSGGIAAGHWFNF